MQSISAGDVTNALTLLADAASKHRDEITEYDAESDVPDSDDENDSTCPVFDSFYNDGGSGAILSMTNFPPDKFNHIWNNVSEALHQTLSVGRGKKSSVGPKDSLFMFLTVLKHGGTWDFLARIFNCKGPNFERIMLRFCAAVSPIFYEDMVVGAARKYSFAHLNEQGKTFENHPYARYATDVCFQQSLRPTGTMAEARPYYSGKHKLHGYKFEASVLPIGVCIGCSSHARGGRSDLEILQSRRTFHIAASTKRGDEQSLEDDGEGCEDFENLWAIIVDKGYQGIKEFLRGIHPIKKPIGRCLTASENRYNRDISSDRIIVENFFGRLMSLWGVLSHKWRWSEEHYDMVLYSCVALTNLHIRYNPLRARDGEFYQKYKNRLLDIGTNTVQKRRMIQKAYRAKRKRDLNIQFRSLEDDDTQPP